MLPPEIAGWMLVFVRLGALVAVAPVFSSPNLPIRLRVALAALGAVLIAPTVRVPELSQAHLFTWVLLMLGEVSVGLLLGYLVRMIFFAVEFGASIISMEMGLNLSGVLNPFSHERSETIGLALFALASLLLLTMNLHHEILVGLQRSYSLVPAGAVSLSPGLFRDVVGRSSQIFHLGLLMAAPLLVVTLLVALILSVLGRAVPQMNVFGESFAIRTLAALAMMGITLNLLAQHISNGLRRLPEDMINVLRLLGG